MQQWEITSRTCGQDSEVVNGDGTITVMVTLFLLAILLKCCVFILFLLFAICIIYRFFYIILIPKFIKVLYVAVTQVFIFLFEFCF